MEAYRVSVVNNHAQYGHGTFVKLTELYRIESDFEAKVEAGFGRTIGAMHSLTLTR